MKYMTIIYAVFLVIMSAVSIITTVYDKIAAKTGNKRISERTLLLYGLFGGAPVMFVTMQIIRHKTKHLKFMIFLPIISALHIALLMYIYFNIT